MKYFIVSDIHGYCDYLIRDLLKEGYERENQNHTLIILGDILDRGTQPKETLDFLMTVPKDNLIMVKGNHEYLLEKLLKKKEINRVDIINGTASTLFNLLDYNYIEGNPFKCRKFRKSVKSNAYLKWLKNYKFKNFYKLDKFILVHSFIPLYNKTPFNIYHLYGEYKRNLEYIPNWGTVKLDKQTWEEATWGCPYMLFKDGFFKEESKKGNVLVCGHWRTSDFFRAYKKEVSNDIFYSPHLIAIDGNTPISEKVNVLVLEEKGGRVVVVKDNKG